MKSLLYSLSFFFCILLTQCCSNLGGANVKSSKPNVPGGQSTGKKNTGDTSTPIDMNKPPNDTIIKVTPPVIIKHNSDDQQKLDSLKRVNMKKKKGL